MARSTSRSWAILSSSFWFSHPQQGQPLVVAGRDLHGLPELGPAEGLAQHQHAEILQFGGDLFRRAALRQQNHAGVGFLYGIGAQLVPELVGQRGVDDNDLESPCRPSGGGLRRRWAR